MQIGSSDHVRQMCGCLLVIRYGMFGNDICHVFLNNNAVILRGTLVTLLPWKW